MVDAQKQRIERAITDLIDDLDRTHLRKMQIDMHLCAAKCCQDKDSSVDAVQHCVDRCSNPLTRAQSYMQNELGDFQGRLQRCVMDCNDDVKLKLSPNPSADEVAKYTNEFERCAVKCVDKHVGLIPQMMKKMKSVLAKGPEGLPRDS